MSVSNKMGNAATLDSQWSKTYSGIKNKHDEAFVAIDQAITLEEREKPNEAIEKYKEGIQHIDDALAIQVQCPDNPDITWEKACVMIQKIKKTRAEVLSRISAIQRSADFVPDIPLEDPPSYEEALAASASSDEEVPRTYRDLATALRDLSVDPNQDMAEEVIYTHDGVRLYFISPNGDVTSALEPETLRISLVEGDEPNTPKAILQVGTWIYPLVPSVSPCYRTDYGAFILPNVHADIPGSSVGIILPSNADKEVFDLLENILHGIISQTMDEKIRTGRRFEEPEDLSSKISNKLLDGAWFLSQGLIRGAEKAGEFFDTSTPKIINNLAVAQEPTAVNPNVAKGIQFAETATNKAAKVTGFVAGKIGAATVSLGQCLAPHIQKQGTRLLATGFKMSDQEASDKMRGILTVAAGAVEGFSTVYRGLETSASILASNLKNNTVKIVEHKYGQPVGTLADGTLMTVGNVYTISQNTRFITPKGLARRTVKDTGRAMVYQYSASNKGSTSYHQLGEPSNSTAKFDGPLKDSKNPQL